VNDLLPPVPPLSSLPGKAAFEAALDTAVSHEQPFALLIADVDDLKIINDLYGHPVGDDAIAAVAHSLQVATGGQVFSFGGDELALMVPGARAEVIGPQLQTLTQTWRDRPLLSFPALYVAASIGGCLFPHEGRDARSLYACADERMYAAKRAGGAQVNLNDGSSEPQNTLHGREQSRLLERQGLLVALKGVLTVGGRAEVIGDPGSGRSTFAGQLERLARLAGLSVLRLSFGPAQRLREEGWRFNSWLDGQLLTSLEQALRLPRPLAIILDLNAEPDAALLSELSPLFDEAKVLLSVGARLPGRLPAEALSLLLEPLSSEAVAALLRQKLGTPLPKDLLAWATEATLGLPARITLLTRLLQQEAGRRRTGLRTLLESPLRDWQPRLLEQLVPLARTRLPPVDGLWGRLPELGRALALLSGEDSVPGAPAGGGRLLCIHGPSGRGKSRLAVQVALELQPRCTAGVLWIDARTYRSTDALLSGMAESLGGQAEDLSGLLRLLPDQNMLLVLDDARDSGGLAALLERLCAAAPSLRLLVTAHRPLGVRGEQTLLLGPLPYEGLGSVAARLVLAAAPELQPEDAARLALYSGGEALDLLLLARAAHLRGAEQVTRELGIRELRPESRPPHPSKTDTRFQDEHVGGELLTLSGQRLSGVAYSWARFSDSERRMMAILSAYDGPFDVAAVQRAAGASDLMASALIQQEHLRPQGSGNYRLPDLIADLGSRELAAQPALRQQARRALFADVQRRMDGHSLLTAEGRAVFDLHRVTTESALRALANGTLWPQLAAFLADACDYWMARGRSLEARDLLQLALAGHVSGGGLRLRTAFARVLQHLGDHEQAESLLRSALRRARRGEDRAAALLTLGRIQHRRSAYAGAVRTFSQLLKDPELSQKSRILALHQRGRAMLYLGHLSGADIDADTALEQARQLGNALAGHALADTLNTLALIRVQQERHAEARAFFEEAADWHQANEDPGGVSLNLTGLAWTMLVSGDAAGAVRAGERLLRVYQDSSSGWEIANTLTNLGHARARLGQGKAARTDFWQALSLTVQIDAPSLQAEVLGGLADLLHREGQWEQAAWLYAVARSHPGNNAEFQHFFAHLETLPLPDSPESWANVVRDLLEELAPVE